MRKHINQAAVVVVVEPIAEAIVGAEIVDIAVNVENKGIRELLVLY